jgi:hypothetical protein
MALLRSIAAVVLALAMAGCGTLAVPERELPQATGTALVERWPLTVALVVAPGVEATSDRAVHDVGTHIGPTVSWALKQRFERVVPAPAADAAGTFRVLGATADNGNVGLRLQLANVAGTPIDEWTIDGKPFATLLQSEAYASALSDAAAVLITALPERPAVRAWLAANGIALPADGPVLRTVPAIGGERAAIALLPAQADAADLLAAYRARKCLGERLQPALEVLERDELRHRMYPWLERSVAPSSAAALLDFLGEPALRATLQSIGVRYIVLFSGKTSTDFDKGGMLCGGGFGAGGCFGYSWGTRDSSFHAVVLDIEQGATAGDPQSRRTAGVYMPAFVIPIPLIAATEGEACDELAKQVRSLVLRPAPK